MKRPNLQDLSVSALILLLMGLSMAAGTNAPSTNQPVKLRSAPSNVPTPLVVSTNALHTDPPLDQHDTNAIMRLPFVQQMGAQALEEGIQFGVLATLRNPDVKDARVLFAIARQLRDAQGGKR